MARRRESGSIRIPTPRTEDYLANRRLGAPRADVVNPIRVIWYTDPHNIWCWGFEPTVRRLEVLYPDTVEIETRQGGLFEDFSPVREQWARMSGGRWKDSVRAFFEAVSSQHRMPMNADAMLES